MPFSRLHESASPPGDFLVVRWPNGALSPHRIDDPAFCDANFIDRREGAIPFRQNMRHENQPYSCDAIKRYLTFDEAEQFIKTTLTPIQTSFQSMLIPATQPSRSHVFRPMASSASQPSLAFVPMHPTSPPAFHNQVSISMPQSPQHQPLTPMTPSPQGSNSLYGNYETSRSDISPCESLSTSGSKNSESQVDNATVIALLEKFLAGQQELLQMTREIQGRLTNVENAVGLSNNKVSSLTDAVMEKNNDAVLMNEKTFLRKPINKDDPPQALAMVGYQELQKQIDEFIDDDGRNLNVTLNGESFYLDAKMLQAAQYVKSPRQFGPYVFQLALDLTHLANFLLGYLETGRVAGQSKRHNKAPKKLLSEDFNKFFGNLCDLCGGCVVAQKSRKQWFMEVRDGLNSKGDNLFAGSPPIYPNLDYMRSGAQHTPRFNNPDQFIAPPLRKRRLIERNDVEVPERVEPEAVAADNEGSN